MAMVTIFLSSYNHEKHIGESIESILAQTFADFKLIIVDDCSQDSSWEIISEYAEKDSRIKAIRHNYNWGRLGMKAMLNDVEGEYIAIAHCDDKWEPTKLEKQIKVLKEREVAACFTLVKLINDEGGTIKKKDHHYYGLFDQPNRTRYEWLNYFFYYGNCLCHPSLLIKKYAYLKYDLIPKGLHGYPDFCQWIRLCKNEDIYILQERLTYFRIHGDESNSSGWTEENLKRIFIEEKLILDEFVEIADSGELIKVFPEAEKYIIGNQIIDRFALAKIMLKSPKSSYILKGLEIIYELFQNDLIAEELQSLYNYGEKDYNFDKQQNDVFHMLGEEKYMNSTIYFQNEEGDYQEDNKIEMRVFLKPSGEFSLKLSIPSVGEERKAKSIRLDLDEGKYRRFQLYQVINNDKKITHRPLNGIRKENIDTFYTMDPQYELYNVSYGKIEIQGKTEPIPTEEIENYILHLKTICAASREKKKFILKRVIKNLRNSKKE